MANAAASAPSNAAGPSMKQTILAAVVVTVISAAMGALFELPLPSRPAAPASDAAAAAAAAAHASTSAGYMDLPPIVANLGGSGDTWIRLEASMVYDVKALPHPEVIAGEIATDELAYLRTATLAQMEGPIGLQNIRQDLSERASIRSGGKVTELIVRTLVVQ
jgi:flagellar FliL protein